MSTSWSYSAYSTAVQCLRRYKLCYVDKISQPGTSGDLAFGSALHSAINSYLTGGDGRAIFEIYWDSYENKDVTYGRFKWEQLKELGINFCLKFKKWHVPNHKLISAESRLYGQYKGVKLEGTPDFIGSYTDRCSLRDFKTSGYNYDKGKALTALQLNLYAFLALENKIVPKIESLGYTVFNKGTGSIQDMTWDFSERTMYKQLDDLVAYCQTMETQTTYPRNVNACLYPSKCPYFEICLEQKKEEEA